MTCKEYEKLIYTFPELDENHRQQVRQHISECTNCQKLFSEVESVFQILKGVNIEKPFILEPVRLTNKIMNEIVRQNIREKERNLFPFYASASRVALAAVSTGILILFFLEVFIPSTNYGRIQGPIANIQGAIIRSENFRKAFTRPKEKKSIFDGCKKLFSSQLDPNCVKEKISKQNFKTK